MKPRIMLLLATAMLAATGGTLPAQTTATQTLMREKLAHSHGVLEALMTSNFPALQLHSTELTRATRSPAWQVLRTPEYRRYTETFLRASEELTTAANARDIDQAIVNYLSMTMACYQCHRYRKAARIADQ